MKRLSALLLAAGAVVAAPAFADTITYVVPVERTVTTYYVWDSSTGAYVERPAYAEEPVVTAPPASTVIYEEPRAVTYSDDIVVTAPRASSDDLVTYDVMDRIATDPGISGRVGVETYRNDVTLTGRVSTPGQAERAGRDARSVSGVREVNNLIRPSVGNF